MTERSRCNDDGVFASVGGGARARARRMQRRGGSSTDVSAVGGPRHRPTRAVTELVGEVHLHQLPGGSMRGRPSSPEHPVGQGKDSITEIDTVATTQEGRARSMVRRIARRRASHDVLLCPRRGVRSSRSGRTRRWSCQVTGSTLVPLIRMWWNAGADAYDSDPAQADRSSSPAGISCTSRGALRLAFEEDLQPRRPWELITPNPTTDFHLSSGAIEVRWTTEPREHRVS